jgi:phage tail-like protein
MAQTGKHILLNQRIGWQAADLQAAVIDDDTGQLCLQTLPSLDRPLVDAQGDFGGLVLPVSIAEDSEGNLYILDAQTLRVKRFDPCTQKFEVLPWLGGAGSGARQFLNPQRIAISARNDLYVVDTGNRRVQVFALQGLSLRAIWGPLQVVKDDKGISVRLATLQSPGWEDDEGDNDEDSETAEPRQSVYPDGTWQPWGIALSSRNWAYVSDYANGLIHVFDAQGRWRTAFTGGRAQGIDGREGIGGRAQGIAPTAQEPALEKPTHIALDKQGRIYIIQEGKDYVTVLDSDGTFLRRVERPADIKGSFSPLTVAVDEMGNIYLCDGSTRRLYYYCRSADGSYASPATCRSFYCTGTALIFDKAGNPLLVDAETKNVFLLKSSVLYESEGTYYSEALDSELYRCQWHRVLLSANVVAGTSITVHTLTSEVAKPKEEILQLPEERWETGQIDSQVGSADWDCLVRSQPGRYLWLRLTLAGDGVASPTVQQVRVYFPRSSSLQYLPATYSEDPQSSEFLARFLSIFDTMRDKISRQITDIASYFDPGATPIGQSPEKDFLAWLASWIGLTLERHWPEKKRRQLLRQAHQLYALRGTPEGLRRHIQLYTDREPFILEHFKLRRWPFLDSTRLGDQSTLWGNAIINRLQLDIHSQVGSFQLVDSGDPVLDPFYRDAHRFTVFVPVRGASTALQQQTLRRIIEMAKPAHTQYTLQLVQPRFRIGVQSMIGMDTVIGRSPEQTVTGEGQLGYGTVLGRPQGYAPTAGKPSTMQIGKRSRIGSSTLIE